MRALEILHEQLTESMGFMHKARWAALWRVVEALIRGKQLWLTALGRARPGLAAPKHSIKAVDRLLSNSTLYSELDSVYAAIASFALGRTNRAPAIAVDTTEVRPKRYALSACLATDGRSIPLFSIIVSGVKPERRTLRRFLNRLARVLPANCVPVLLTDAGFESVWFEELEAMGWDYVGRVRNRTRFLVKGQWVKNAKLYARVGNRAQNLGRIAFPRRAPCERRLVLSKKHKSGHRRRKTARGTERHKSGDKVYRRSANEPWLLATSLTCRPSHVVSIYGKRMQIEETFRDAKNHRWGWSLCDTRSRTKKRLEILLLIAAIAYLFQLLVGIAGERRNLHYRHQANTERRRRVISLFFLGAILLASRDLERLRKSDLRHALKSIRKSTVMPQR